VAHDDRTEKPTAKRRADARKKGQVARSPELSSLLVLGGAFGFLSLMGPSMLSHMESAMRDSFLSTASPDLAHGGLNTALNRLVQTVLVVVLPLIAAAAGGGLLASVMQVRPGLFLTQLKPDFKRINPASGVKRLVSPHSLTELIKNLAKLLVVGAVVFVTIYPRRHDVAQLGGLPPTEAVGFIASLIVSLAWRVIGTFAVIAIADVALARRRHEKSLKMSKEEVKQEAKQQDMSPQLKGRMRSAARSMARARMLGNVKKADVVVTNPTHFAVALSYRAGENAPRVLAKGADLLAFKIRTIAREHAVAIVENPPLARQLYADVEVGQEVPVQMFALVAEVLAYVWRTSRRKQYAWV
jgi:flagellar biosynthetic protein FlhB